jgi:hypothetical protein
MRGSWTGLGLLLVVPWLTQCTTGRLIRLETGEGPPLVYTPASPEPPPIEIPQQVFFDTLTDLLLTAPLTIYPPRQGQVMSPLKRWPEMVTMSSRIHLKGSMASNLITRSTASMRTATRQPLPALAISSSPLLKKSMRGRQSALSSTSTTAQ